MSDDGLEYTPESLFRPRKGDKGDTGARGARGERGLPKRTRRAILFLFFLNFALIAIGYLFLSNIVKGNTAQRCASIDQTVGIPVPVPTQDNPSRETWAKFSLIQRHRGAELGCDMPPPKFITSPP